MNRRWTLLLPVIFVSYSLSYLDRANFSFGAAAGMAKDLGISPAGGDFPLTWRAAGGHDGPSALGKPADNPLSGTRRPG